MYFNTQQMVNAAVFSSKLADFRAWQRRTCTEGTCRAGKLRDSGDSEIAERMGLPRPVFSQLVKPAAAWSGSKEERAEVADEAEAASREHIHIGDVADGADIDGDNAMDASFLAG